MRDLREPGAPELDAQPEVQELVLSGRSEADDHAVLHDHETVDAERRDLRLPTPCDRIAREREFVLREDSAKPDDRTGLLDVEHGRHVGHSHRLQNSTALGHDRNHTTGRAHGREHYATR